MPRLRAGEADAAQCGTARPKHTCVTTAREDEPVRNRELERFALSMIRIPDWKLDNIRAVSSDLALSIAPLLLLQVQLAIARLEQRREPT